MNPIVLSDADQAWIRLTATELYAELCNVGTPATPYQSAPEVLRTAVMKGLLYARQTLPDMAPVEARIHRAARDAGDGA